MNERDRKNAIYGGIVYFFTVMVTLAYRYAVEMDNRPQIAQEAEDLIKARANR